MGVSLANLFCAISYFMLCFLFILPLDLYPLLFSVCVCVCISCYVMDADRLFLVLIMADSIIVTDSIFFFQRQYQPSTVTCDEIIK